MNTIIFHVWDLLQKIKLSRQENLPGGLWSMEPQRVGQDWTHFKCFPRGTSGKEITSQCRRHKRCGFSLWVGKIPWRRKWQPTPIFLPGEFQGQRSLAGCSQSMGLQRAEHDWSDLAPTQEEEAAVCPGSEAPEGMLEPRVLLVTQENVLVSSNMTWKGLLPVLS